MNLASYLQKRQAEQNARQENPGRKMCRTCFQPHFACYCSQIKKLKVPFQFVILIHPIEVRRRIATGRMSHLCLENSYLISGKGFSQDQKVNEIIADKNNYCVILYPGQPTTNISQLTHEERIELFPKNKQLVIFVVDGTWATAGKMLRQSENLLALPRICFTPEKLSNFRVRKQPKPECYSTIEAIHFTISLLSEVKENQEHDRLLKVFDWMVENQLRYIERAPEPVYRRETKKQKQLS